MVGITVVDIGAGVGTAARRDRRFLMEVMFVIVL